VVRAPAGSPRRPASTALPNVFAIAERRFAEQIDLPDRRPGGVAGVGPRCFPPMYCLTVRSMGEPAGARLSCSSEDSMRLCPIGREAKWTAISASDIEQCPSASRVRGHNRIHDSRRIRRLRRTGSVGVHPDHASLDLGSQIEGNVNVRSRCWPRVRTPCCWPAPQPPAGECGKVMAVSTGPKISSCATVARGMHIGEQVGGK